jgi:hypothetical protein
MALDMELEANLASLALVRLAVEHRDHSGGSVMEAIAPYLEKVIAEESGENHLPVDAVPALTRLLASLSQFAGAAFEAYITERSHGVPSKEALLAGLDQFEQGFLHDAEEAGGGE